MEAKEDWAGVTLIMKRKAVNSRRIRAKMMAKTQKQIEATYEDDPDHAKHIIADATNNGRKVPDRLAPLDDTKARYLVEWELSVTGDQIMVDETELSATGEIDSAGISKLTDQGDGCWCCSYI